MAYRLAVYLSAALPGQWGLELARVIQVAALPDSGQVHLAEVLVGGLVFAAERPEWQNGPAFEFIEGVADVLRRSLTGTEALRVLQVLGGRIERETGRSPGIAARLLGGIAPTDASEEHGNLQTGAIDLIDAMGLTRIGMVSEPASEISGAVAGLGSPGAATSGPATLTDPVASQSTAQDAQHSTARGRSLERFLVASVPRRASPSSVVNVAVAVSADTPKNSATAVSVRLHDLAVEGEESLITVVVELPTGLVALGGMSQSIRIPATGDSQQVNFVFRAEGSGSHGLSITAWAGGTSIGSLSIELTVEEDDKTRQPATLLGDSRARAGEVVLQVNFGSSRYTFQLLSESHRFEPVVADIALDRAANEFARVVDLFSAMSSRNDRGGSQEIGVRRVKETGVRLWRELVPRLVQEQFWQIQDSISAFTIAADQDIIPWELLYPLAPGRDEGFLVEQFPVMRRAPGWRRSRRIALGGTRFVLSSSSLSGARDEVAAVQRILTQFSQDAPTIGDLRALLDLFDSGDAGSLYFTGHIKATGSDGATIALADGPIIPTLLAYPAGQQPMIDRQSLVFFNICRGPREDLERTQVSDLARQFITAGASAFVGNSWTVLDSSGRMFVEAFYGALAAGLPFGEAIRRARLQTHEHSNDFAWLAYAAYGDPTAQAESLPEAPELPLETPHTTASGSRQARRRTGAARIVAVHGLGQQWAGAQALQTTWLAALRDGLGKVGAGPLADEDLAVAYYGDLFRVTSDASAELDAEHPDRGIDEELVVPLWRAAADEQGVPGPESTSETSGQGLVQRVLRVLSSSRFFGGLSERLLVGDLRQLTTLVREPAVLQAAQGRIAAEVGPETRIVVAHSIGSIVAYGALCAHPEWDIRMFVTLGSPLGLRYVFERLSPPPRDGIGSWPGSVRQWTNIFDADDILAVESRLAAKFAGSIRDIRVDNGARAHDLGRYLTATATAGAIAEGLAD